MYSKSSDIILLYCLDFFQSYGKHQASAFFAGALFEYIIFLKPQFSHNHFLLKKVFQTRQLPISYSMNQFSSAYKALILNQRSQNIPQRTLCSNGKLGLTMN